MIQLRKKSLKTWLHIDSIFGEFILSKFYISIDGTKIQIVEQGESKRRQYDLADIQVYDDTTSGVLETFSTITALSLRLEQLKYPAFYKDGSNTGVSGGINYQEVQFNLLAGETQSTILTELSIKQVLVGTNVDLPQSGYSYNPTTGVIEITFSDILPLTETTTIRVRSF